MVSCIIVDDEPNAVSLLEDHIQKIPFLRLKHKSFDAFDASAFLEKEPVDLVLLDINMPGMSGMELAAILPKTQRIIFTTAYSSYALEGYEFNVIDYLLKPITFKRFMQAAAKVRDHFALTETEDVLAENAMVDDYIFIKSGRE